MCTQRPGRPHVALWTFSFLLGLLLVTTADPARPAFGQAVIHKIEAANERLELTANTSRILTLEHKIPRAQVNNPELLTLTPLSPNQVQISAKSAGVTQVNLWDDKGQVYSVDVIIYGDVKELEMALKMQFPHSSVRVYRYSQSLVLTGFVDRPDHVSRIVRLADDYSPKVINNISVGGVQQILLYVRVMEVSRTKLRTCGFDFSSISGGGDIVSSISGLILTDTTQSIINRGIQTTVERPNALKTLSFSILDGDAAFLGLLEALRQNDLLKILAEPTLTTVSGRPASFNVGGEFPILVPQSLGTVSIEYKKYGTQIDFVPIVLGNGNVRLEVRPRVSEIDPTRSIFINQTSIPGLRVREVDTGVEMKAGQTLALAGLIQNRVEAQNRGVPLLADLPWVGAAFRRVHEVNNEIELLITVRPEFVAALDPHQVPPGGPGLDTTSPDDCELYLRGYIEVPRCGPDGDGTGTCQADDRASEAQAPETPADAGAPAIEPIPADSSTAVPPSTPQEQWQSSRRQPVLTQPTGPGLRQPGDSADGRRSRHDGSSSEQPNQAAASGQPPHSGGLVGPIGYDVEK